VKNNGQHCIIPARALKGAIVSNALMYLDYDGASPQVRSFAMELKSFPVNQPLSRADVDQLENIGRGLGYVRELREYSHNEVLAILKDDLNFALRAIQRT
jgi:hypothetical protein